MKFKFASEDNPLSVDEVAASGRSDAALFRIKRKELKRCSDQLKYGAETKILAPARDDGADDGDDDDDEGGAIRRRHFDNHYLFVGRWLYLDNTGTAPLTIFRYGINGWHPRSDGTTPLHSFDYPW